MPDEIQTNSLLLVLAAAFAVPVLFALIPRAPVPALVGEVLAGVALGTSGLGLVTVGPWLSFLSLFGLAYLLFLAGFEVDYRLLLGDPGHRGDLLRSPLALSIAGMAVRLVLALAIAGGLVLAGLVRSPVLVALLLSSTSLGVVLSVLTERRLLSEPFGQLVIVGAAVADVTTVLALTVLFSADQRSPGAQLALVGVIIGVGGVVVVALRRLTSSARARARFDPLAGAASQIRIRGSLLLLMAFVALAVQLGLEVILGAFIAGAVISSLTPVDPAYRVKLEAVGYGLFVPVFFIVVGVRFDLPQLLEDSRAVVLVPILTVAIFTVKGVAAWTYRGRLSARDCLAAGALQSAQLTLTVAGVEIGMRLGLIERPLGSALIAAALLTVLLAPVLFARLRPSSPRARSAS